MSHPTPSTSSSPSSSSSGPDSRRHPPTPPQSTSTPSSSHLSPTPSTTTQPRLSALQFNNVIQPVLDSSHSSVAFQNTQPVKPEKCLTFCSQRNDGPPLCRMFCLRRRPMRVSQAEDLARLRPSPVNGEVKDRTESGSGWKWTTPFDGLSRRLEPYSFVYARGTPDGVVGRYMEELEFDDGIRDFGVASRGTVESKRRTWEDDKLEVLDWGTEGSLIHLPLTSVFYPVLLIPKTLTRIFTPTYNLLQAYKTSFTDGGQRRSVEKLGETIQDGGAVKLLKMFQENLVKRAERNKESMEKQAATKAAGSASSSPAIQTSTAAMEKKKEIIAKANMVRDQELQRLKDRAVQRASAGTVKKDVGAKQE